MRLLALCLLLAGCSTPSLESDWTRCVVPTDKRCIAWEIGPPNFPKQPGRMLP